ERLQNEAVEFFNVDWSTAIGGGLSGTFGQGVSWMTAAGRDAASAKHADATFGASWECARGWRWPTSDRAAGEAARSPVHSTPSSDSPGLKAGQTFEASPTRAPRGPPNHSRG